MCILVVALQCHPDLPFVCAHNRDEQRTRDSRDDAWEPDSQIICGRDGVAGGTVLGLHARTGRFAALTNCRSVVRWKTGVTSRGVLVEHLLKDGFENLESFLDASKVDPFHVVAGTAFGHEPELGYAWHVAAEPTEPAEKDRAGEDAEWSRGKRTLGTGVFVISNANPEAGTWPKCDWLQRQVQGFLAALPRGDADTSMVQRVQAGLAEIMTRFDVDDLTAPSRLPRWFSTEKEVQLHSGPFTPWRPTLQDFGTVSQRILVSDAKQQVVHYFHRCTNLATGEGKPPGMSPWGHFVVHWPEASPPLCACL